MSKIIGIGETVLDVIFKNDRPLEAVPGGSTFNALISLGRTVGRMHPEVPILMVTQTGDDHIGDLVCSFMKNNGVSTDAVSRIAGSQTDVSMAFLDEHDNAQYEFYKNHAQASLQKEKTGITFEEDDLVLFGSYFAINPAIRENTVALLTAARNAGATIYYDINFRKNHLADLGRTMPFIEQNCSLSSWVRGSDEDFGYLYGTTDPDKVYSDHIAPLCRNFICTCGAGPIHIFTESGHSVFPVEKIRTVSTIGAGDNFNAGFLYGLLNRRRNLEEIVRTATRFSSAVCQSIYNYVDPGFNPDKSPEQP